MDQLGEGGTAMTKFLAMTSLTLIVLLALIACAGGEPDSSNTKYFGCGR